jgi:hypothetical protein
VRRGPPDDKSAPVSRATLPTGDGHPPTRQVFAIQLFGPRVATRVLLLFWATWFSVVLATNAVDALQEAALIGAASRFASGNFSLVAEAVAPYGIPRSGAAALFALVLLLELVAAGLFWRALLSPARATILAAFVAATVLFGGFLVCDELLLVYRRFPHLETGHFVILCTLLLSSLIAGHRTSE